MIILLTVLKVCVSKSVSVQFCMSLFVYTACVLSVCPISESGMSQDIVNPDDQHSDPVLHVLRAQGTFTQSHSDSVVVRQQSLLNVRPNVWYNEVIIIIPKI